MGLLDDIGTTSITPVEKPGAKTSSFADIGTSAGAPQRDDKGEPLVHEGLTDEQGNPVPGGPLRRGQRKLLDNAPDDNAIDTILKQAGTIAVKGVGAIGGVYGDMDQFAKYLAQRAKAFTSGKSLEQVQRDAPKYTTFTGSLPSSEDITKPIYERLGEYKPQTMLGRAIQEGSAGAISALNPVAAGRATATAAPRIILPALAKTAPAAGAAAGVGSAVTEMTGDPLLGAAAGIPTAAVAGVGTHIIDKGLERGTAAGRQRAADEQLAALFNRDREGGMRRLAGREHDDMTTGEASMMPDVLFTERKAQQLDPGFQADKLGIDTRQNNRLHTQAQSLVPLSSANPEDVITTFRMLRGQLDSRDAARVQQAQRTLSAADASVPGRVSAEQAGNAVRDPLHAADQQLVGRYRELYNSLDPDNTFTLSLRPIVERARQIAGELTPGYSDMHPEVQKALIRISAFPEVDYFNNMHAFEKQLTNDMFKLSGGTGADKNAARQLRDLRTAVRGAVDNAADEQIRWQADAVRRGVMREEDTFAANLQRLLDEYRQHQAELAGSVGQGATASAGSPSSFVSPAMGTTRAGSAGPATPGSSARIPPPGSEPNLPTEVGERLREAQALRRERGETFESGVVGKILETDERGRFDILSSRIPNLAFPSGNTGGQIVSQILDAHGSSPAMVSAMETLAINALHDKIGRGALDQRALDSWRNSYREGLAAIDRVSPGFSSRFDNVASARQSLVDAQAMRQANMEAFENGAAARYLGANSAEEVVTKTGQMLSAPDAFTQVRDTLAAGGVRPELLAGLQRAGVDWLLQKATNNAVLDGQKVVSGAKLGDFVRSRAQALELLYGPDGVRTLEAMVDNLDRGTEAARMANLPGSPTANIQAARLEAIHKGHPDLSFSTLMAFSGFNPLAIASGLGVKITQAAADRFKTTNAQAINRLFLDMLADPRKAEAGLARAYTPDGRPNIAALSVLMADPSDAALDVDRRRKRASGGGVRINHEREADRLIRQAALALRNHSNDTKQLMQVPDEHVTKALAIANEAI